MLVLLMGGIYKVRRSDGLKCHDIHTKIHEDWYRHSKIDVGVGGLHIQTHRAHNPHLTS
jgi:hypothetical protein